MTYKQQALIDGVELALDWGLDVPEEDLEAYFELIKERDCVFNVVSRKSYGWLSLMKRNKQALKESEQGGC